MLPRWCCIANRHIGAREPRQLILSGPFRFWFVLICLLLWTNCVRLFDRSCSCKDRASDATSAKLEGKKILSGPFLGPESQLNLCSFSVWCFFLCGFCFFGFWCFFVFVSWMSVTVHRGMYRSSTSLLLRPLQQRPLRDLINQLIPTATCS